jgi:DNA-binding response OmpR family regulator
VSINRFHDLIPYRVREILLVSSPYDAFILEEDGRLSEQLYNEFTALDLSAPPRVHQAATSKEALARLKDARFDLVVVMSSLADASINDFAHKVRKKYKGKPIVYLALDPREIDDAEEALDWDVVDSAYLWTGDSSVLLGIVKLVEDRLNADHDTAAGVRVILFLEDSPSQYSTFLGLLYEELMKQARSLYFEGLNELQRKLYMATRPKILHAKSYEDGLRIYKRYSNRLLAMISDVRLPREGELDPKAGLDLARRIRRDLPDLPLLFQSAEKENKAEAEELGGLFVKKASRHVLSRVRHFLREYLGFGDFVFRLSDGTEIARASDVGELRQRLQEVPEECIEFHASHDHFSIWLMARSEFELAEQLRPKKISDFPTIEALRAHLLAQLRQTLSLVRSGIVTEFNAESLREDNFSRIGEGSIGAKARGLAFLHRRLGQLVEQPSATLPVRVPRTVALTTEVFDDFVDEELVEWAIACQNDEEVARRFLARSLPVSLMSDLGRVVEEFRRPLAVRSSSMLEDSANQPFAGIYATLMIPNSAESARQRREELATAIRLVWASTYYRDACAYRDSTGLPAEREKMGVMIQGLVGCRHGTRFYPTISGVGLTRNFYPIGPQRPEHGVVHLALGLGRMIVDGGRSLRFSPRHPEVLPQIATPQSALKSTQREFFGVELAVNGSVDPMDAVRTYELRDAEEDGSLSVVGSVWSRGDERLVEDLSLPGPRVVSFNNILKHRALPMVETLRRLMGLARQGLGREVEIEFALQMDKSGPGGVWCNPELVALQVRPMTARPTLASPPKPEFAVEDLLCASRETLGHGVERGIRDVVYVKPQTWDASHNRTIAHEIGRLNEQLKADNRPYLLLGPGRWGSADPWLGIPVQWSQISHVRAMIEASPSSYQVEPSQGTHFFQNITSLRIGYFTLPPGSGKPKEGGEFIDLDWLDAQTAVAETQYLRLVRFDQPLTVLLRGREGEGMIVKPGAESL